jgi:hypothetical protein
LRPKVIALNALLLLALGIVIWRARLRWEQAQALRRSTLNVPVIFSQPQPYPLPKPEAAVATKYADVAEKNLFSKDRNAVVIVEPPKVEIPKPMPALPIVYGVMGLPSGVRAIMSDKKGSLSTTIRAGDTIGEFKVAALDTQNVTFEWNDKQVTRKIDDLIDRSNSQTASNGSPAPAAAAPSGPAAAPPPPPAAPARPATAADLGDSTSASTRAVKPGDTSPVGSTVDGYKKTCVATPFGNICQWIRQ